MAKVALHLVAFDEATQSRAFAVQGSIQGAGKITIYEKNGEHRASLDITGSYVLTLPAAV